MNENEELPVAKKGPDRLTLGKLESEKVDKWLLQINLSSKGFLTLTKSDIVNFLIRSYRDELQTKELQRIRSEHYDPIKHINWISPQLKLALAESDLARIAELQEELRGVELSVVRTAMSKDEVAPREKNKLRKRKSNLKPTQDEMKNVTRFEEIQGDLPED